MMPWPLSTCCGTRSTEDAPKPQSQKVSTLQGRTIKPAKPSGFFETIKRYLRILANILYLSDNTKIYEALRGKIDTLHKTVDEMKDKHQFSFNGEKEVDRSNEVNVADIVQVIQDEAVFAQEFNELNEERTFSESQKRHLKDQIYRIEAFLNPVTQDPKMLLNDLAPPIPKAQPKPPEEPEIDPLATLSQDLLSLEQTLQETIRNLRQNQAALREARKQDSRSLANKTLPLRILTSANKMIENTAAYHKKASQVLLGRKEEAVPTTQPAKAEEVAKPASLSAKAIYHPIFMEKFTPGTKTLTEIHGYIVRLHGSEEFNLINNLENKGVPLYVKIIAAMFFTKIKLLETEIERFADDSQEYLATKNKLIDLKTLICAQIALKEHPLPAKIDPINPAVAAELRREILAPSILPRSLSGDREKPKIQRNVDPVDQPHSPSQPGRLHEEAPMLGATSHDSLHDDADILH